MRFVDTSVLLYAVSKAPEEKAKAELARGLLEERDLALSVQVLQEFYVQATRRGKKDPLTHEQAVLLIESWLRFPVQENTVELLRAAFATCKRFGLSYWDAMIIEAARAFGCGTVLSEDFSSDQDYNGIRVTNPFAMC